MAGLWLAGPGAVGASEAVITTARYDSPTRAYAHGVLGDDIEYTGLVLRLSNGRSERVDLGASGRVFEDLAPRLWDMTGDGRPEVVVVETDPPVGARLAVYGLRAGRAVRLAATPPIGQTKRWLAPLGAADLDGDGAVEIAYVDRPHLARVLRVWRFGDDSLHEVAAARGFSNHRLGAREILGGIRDCGAGPEIVVPSGDWRRIMAVRLEGDALRARPLAAFGRPALAAALACRS